MSKLLFTLLKWKSTGVLRRFSFQLFLHIYRMNLRPNDESFTVEKKSVYWQLIRSGSAGNYASATCCENSCKRNIRITVWAWLANRSYKMKCRWSLQHREYLETLWRTGSSCKARCSSVERDARIVAKMFSRVMSFLSDVSAILT